MSKADDELEKQRADNVNWFKDAMDKELAKNDPVLREKLEKQLPPVELTLDEYRRLCKKERSDYRNRKGRFSLDPDEREMGESVQKDHLVWDVARLVAFVSLFSVICADWEELIPPVLVITVLVFILGHIFAGEMWYK